ncbi:membrane protein implicated in regulation of membrane protease activity [Rhizobium sp. BK313]|uniref:NfeD family protein n=1 Tax=Rhizobium sp. BK313 TaxID=2587081 RepID=UPI00105D4E49|nr:NfeD family protein [Rhizobium sp. BK313]MBB3455878.1 membrane protein implicated in regulation of membrane protease activity [Rhizobium sp. BK313]
MPQIIFFIVAVGGLWFLYRRFLRDARKLTEKSRRAESERRTGAIGTLVKDPKTGEYRVKRDDE